MSRLVLAAGFVGLTALPATAGGCASGACYRQTYVPPSYETVTEKVMVRAPRTYAITTPARYGTVHETVQVSPGGRHWSVSYDAHGHQVGCWVYTKPRYATVARTVMTQAPEVVPYAVPAQYGYRQQTVQTSAGYRAWAPISGGYRGGHGGGYGGGHEGGGFGGGYGGGYEGGGYRSTGYRGGYGRGADRGYGGGYGRGYGGGLVGGAIGSGIGLAGAGLATGGALAGGALGGGDFGEE